MTSRRSGSGATAQCAVGGVVDVLVDVVVVDGVVVDVVVVVGSVVVV